ncbi:TetR/AcrR family transcriptional regulator [Klebsiella pneumoniae]|nr:TetR/AcrR family transcriptional regulator [Klebsiella pneumoniae]
MEAKQADILRHASALFNREGYQSPSIERIAEHAGISKMTFYRYYAKEALILLSSSRGGWLGSKARITADKASAQEKLFAVFDYYHRWFTCRATHSCMFTRACLNIARHLPAIRAHAPDLSHLWQFFRDILLQVLKPEPAERWHDDGDAHRWRHRRPAGRVRRMPGEIPPGVTAWAQPKRLLLLRRRYAVR